MNNKIIFRTIIAITCFATQAFAQVETIHADEVQAKIIGNQKTYTFLKVGDKGENLNEIKGTSCLPDINFETHATWLKLNIAEKGTLAFDIAPLYAGDDFDFILFKQINNKKEEIRCMAAGEIIGAPTNQSALCRGITGLRTAAKDNIENKGCASGKDNFLSAVQTTEGEEFILCINNYANNNGFQITFTGTAIIGEPTDFPQTTFSDCTPNPTRQNTSITIIAQTQSNLNYILMAANGLIIYNRNTLLQKGANVLDLNAAEDLSLGTYKVILKHENKTIERTFVKQ